MLRSPFVWIALLAIAVIGGPLMCASQPAEVVVPPPPPDAPSELVSVSPRSLRLSDSGVASQTLDVSYRIRLPQQVTKAWVEVEIETIGKIAQMDLPIQASGSVRFDVIPSHHSLGPHVQFRANCPQGTTDWHSMGSPPPSPEARQADGLQITSVGPNVLRWTPSLAEGRGGGGFNVSINGTQITRDCQIEAKVNGAPVELHGVRHTGRRFEVLLYYEDIGHQAITPRYAQLRLGLERAGGKTLVSIVTLPFD